MQLSIRIVASEKAGCCLRGDGVWQPIRCACIDSMRAASASSLPSTASASWPAVRVRVRVRDRARARARVRVGVGVTLKELLNCNRKSVL